MKVLMMILTLAAAINAQASKRDLQEIFTYQCGSIEDVAKIGGADAAAISDKDRQGLIESRKNTLDVIRGGKAAVDAIVKKGSQDNSGFGVLLACGLVDQLSEKIKSEGCLDIEKNEIVKAGPGLDDCRMMIADVKK